jgi:enoyl-CoA hydratase/carnithine racemase
MNETPQFAVNVEDAIAYLDLNRPEEGNTLTRPMMVQLAAELRTLGARPDVNVVAIQSRGAAFCKGRDGRGEQSASVSAYDMRVHMMGATLGVYEAIAAVPVPVVACVHALANGFGGALAGTCDITLAADTATFAFPEIEHGIPPTMAMCAIRGTVPAKALAYLIYSAETISAGQAVDFGLASRIWPAAEFSAEAEKFIKKLAAKPRIILETIKRYQTKSAGLTPDMASEYAGTLMALVRTKQ